MYLNAIKEAEELNLWFKRLSQSFTKLDLKNSFSLQVIEFVNEPLYCKLIFSYHFCLPIAFLRLKG